ncbi:MAG: hypothetical protein H6607_06275 [Flavobacteriales bacterium]|nr:hypothetical protein [Flavobacteriales bacterium]
MKICFKLIISVTLSLSGIAHAQNTYNQDNRDLELNAILNSFLLPFDTIQKNLNQELIIRFDSNARSKVPSLHTGVIIQLSKKSTIKKITWDLNKQESKQVKSYQKIINEYLKVELKHWNIYFLDGKNKPQRLEEVFLIFDIEKGLIKIKM